MRWQEYIALAILAIWFLGLGLSQAGEKKGAFVIAPIKARTFSDIMRELVVPEPSQITGVITTMNGMQLMLKGPDGSFTLIDFSVAARSPEFPPIGTGKKITAIGKLDGDGILHASIIWRTDQ